MTMTPEKLQQILEAAIMVSDHPLSIAQMQKMFDEGQEPPTADIKVALNLIAERYLQSGVALNEVASGYQFQARTELSPWLSRLWEERPQRYSRAFLETLALIAYRQPITRAEVEEIRGVSVSSNIVKTLQEREWIRIVGYRDVPGKPALYGTTKTFLDHFNLKSLDELPTLAELKDLESQEAKLQVQLELNEPETAATTETTMEEVAATTENTEEATIEENAPHIATEIETETPATIEEEQSINSNE